MKARKPRSGGPLVVPQYASSTLRGMDIERVIRVWKRTKRRMHTHPTDFALYPTFDEMEKFAREGRCAAEWKDPYSVLTNEQAEAIPTPEMTSFLNDLRREDAIRLGTPLPEPLMLQVILLGGSNFWWHVVERTFKNNYEVQKKKTKRQLRLLYDLENAHKLPVSFRRIDEHIFACFPMTPPKDPQYGEGYIHSVALMDTVDGRVLINHPYDTKKLSVAAEFSQFSELKKVIESNGVELKPIQRMRTKWWTKKSVDK